MAGQGWSSATATKRGSVARTFQENTSGVGERQPQEGDIRPASASPAVASSQVTWRRARLQVGWRSVKRAEMAGSSPRPMLVWGPDSQGSPLLGGRTGDDVLGGISASMISRAKNHDPSRSGWLFGPVAAVERTPSGWVLAICGAATLGSRDGMCRRSRGVGGAAAPARATPAKVFTGRVVGSAE